MSSVWNSAPLGEICRIRTGRKDVNQGNPNGAYPFFTCAVKHTYSDTYSFDTEALLIAGNGDVGKVSYYSGRFEAYQRTYVLSDFSKVLPRFLFYLLDGKLRDSVSKQKLGNTMPYIKIGMLASFQVPIPSLSEQKRIAGILDRAYEAIDTVKGNGRKTLLNAQELFENYLSSAFEDNSSKLEIVPLRSCVEFRNGLNFTKSSKGQTVEVVGVGDFRNEFFAPLDELKSVTLDAQLAQDDKLKDDDLLVVRSNGNVELIGRTMLARGVGNRVISHSGFTIRIRQTLRKFDPSYLCYFLRSRSTRRKLVEGGTGTNIKSLNQGMLGGLSVPCPSLRYQREIVASLEKVSAEVQRLRELYQRREDSVSNLKAAVLSAAFNGSL